MQWAPPPTPPTGPLDTSAQARASVINMDLLGWGIFPMPDGSLATQKDRQQMAGKYTEILAGAPGGAVTTVLYHGFFRGVNELVFGRVN